MNNVKPIFVFNFAIFSCDKHKIPKFKTDKDHSDWFCLISSDGLVGLLFLGSNLWIEE